MQKKNSSRKNVKKSGKGMLIAEALAGVTLLATMAGCSIYLVTHGKKVDLKKMKLSVLKEAHKMRDDAMKTEKMMEAKMKKMHR